MGGAPICFGRPHSFLVNFGINQTNLAAEFIPCLMLIQCNHQKTEHKPYLTFWHVIVTMGSVKVAYG